jgi:multidrug efflux pump subunit AcrB
MPKEQFPEISFPTVYVNTPYFGNSAVDIENLVTRPLEKEVGTITGLEELNSTSIQDYSVIVAEFETDYDIDDALRKVKDAVDRAKSELPTDMTEEPRVVDVNLSEIPIMTVNLSGDYNMDRLKDFAEHLEDKIENIPEISDAEIKGDREREMKVNVDPYKMQSLEISFTDIENAISAENLTMSGGEIVQNKFRRAIRIVGEFEDAKELQKMIVKSEGQDPVYLRDIAEVEFGYKERSSISRANGLPVISVDVIKRQGENLLEASDKVKETIDKIGKDYFPDDLQVQLFNDQSVNTRNQVNNLENSIISGVILVTLVLLFFLGLRNASFVGLAIPMSMLLGIMILYLLGYTLNVVVLFSLILALGLLVDNGIVVVENIYRYVQEGYSPMEASKHGAGEVAVPIIASTATTLAAFTPLIFWPGIAGEFFSFLPITLMVVLTSSLFVALVINPVFTSNFMKIDERAEDPATRNKRRKNILLWVAGIIVFAWIFHFVGVEWLRNALGIAALLTLINFFLLRPSAFYFQNNFLPRLEVFYDDFVRAALSGFRPILIFIGTVALLVIAVLLIMVRQPKVEFFPNAQPVYVNAFVEMPLGTDIERTNEVVRQLEHKVNEVIEPYEHIVEAVLVQIGENTADPSGPPEPGATPNKARITVEFVKFEERGGINTFNVMEKLRQSMQGYAGVDIVVDKNQDGPPTGKPINIEIQGDDIEDLTRLSQNVIQYIEEQKIPGIEELQADVEIGKPELEVSIKRAAARRYGLSTYSIANAIRTAVFGKEVSKYKKGEDEYPINVRLKEEYRNDVSNIMNQRITFRDPASGRITQVPISAVAEVDYSSTYSAIKRKDQQRMITIYSNVLAGYNANEVVEDIRLELENYDWPEDFTYRFTGEQENQAETSEFLNRALLIAIFLIFLILVAQFNSIFSPFIILITVILSTIGVFLGLVISGDNIVIVMTGVGIISLAGIVVNNAIVLIDYIDLTIKRKRLELGYDKGSLPMEDVKEAIVEAGGIRLRPVLLTAITTILGLIPLAIGLNINFFTLVSDFDPQFFMGGENVAFWGPMAKTVIYGLTFATFLTLIVVPIMYWLTYRVKYQLKKLISKVS